MREGLTGDGIGAGAGVAELRFASEERGPLATPGAPRGEGVSEGGLSTPPIFRDGVPVDAAAAFVYCCLNAIT